MIIIFLSSDFSSDSVSSDEHMVECLNKTDKVMEENNNKAEVTREMCDDARLEDLIKYKIIIKRKGNKVEVSTPTTEASVKGKMKGLLLTEDIPSKLEGLK